MNSQEQVNGNQCQIEFCNSLEFGEEIIVKDVICPEQVKLLRTSTKLSFTFKNSTLRIQVPASLRTELDDVVPVDLQK